MWGPCIMYASICSVDHSEPQLKRHQSVGNYCRRYFARWWVEYVRGHMSLSSPILSLVFSPSGIEISLLIACFDETLRCWDVWAKDSAGVVGGSFRMGPFSVLGTDVMSFYEVWIFTGWSFYGFAGGGDNVAMNIGIGIDLGGWLRYAPMVTSLIYSAAWSEYEKHEIMLVIFIVTCTLWSVFIIWIIFYSKVPCNSTRKVVKYVLHMNVEIKHEIILLCLYLLFSPTLTAWTWLVFLITLSNIFTMCLASSYVALRWFFLH